MANNFPYDYHVSYTYQAVSDTVIAAAQTLTGAGSMTLSTTTTMTDGVNHQITLVSTGDISGVNFTITGTDVDGVSLTETITGPNNSTVASTKYYYTVTSIVADGAVGTNTSAGINALTRSRRIPVEHRSGSFNVGLAVVKSGTVTFDVDMTYDDIYANAPGVPACIVEPTWFTPSAFSGKSANTDGALANPCTAIALRTESYSSTPTVQLHLIQNKAT